MRHRSVCALAAALAALALGATARAAAAQPSDTAALDAALAAIAKASPEHGRKPFVAVEAMVNAVAQSPAARSQVAAKLAAMLGADATLDAKKFVAKQLSLIGGDAEVPALAKLLGDKELSLAARSALARIPGDASLKALIAAVPGLKGADLIGVINTLGERRDERATGAVTPFIAAEDLELAAAAMEALGKIGGAEALKALHAARMTVRARLQPVRADALMRALYAMAQAGASANAALIFLDVAGSDQPDYIRVAAFLGLLRCEPDKAAQRIEAALQGKDSVLQGAALRYIRTRDDPALLKLIERSSDPALRAQAARARFRERRPANLALGATATSPDDLEKDGQASGDQAAIDGDPDTYWDEVDNQKLYRLRVAFKQPTDVSAISIMPWQPHDHAPRDFEIICDGKSVAQVSGATYDENEHLAIFPRTRCSTLELKITGYYPRSPAIRELEIYDLESASATQPPKVAEPRAAQLSWRQTDGLLALVNGERVVWQFNFGKDQAKPCFHPLALLDGTALTWLRPPDHVWHRALWFSWKYLNGLNYWEEDAKTGLAPGRTEVVDAKIMPRDDFSALMELTIAYRPADKPAVLTEKRSLAVSAPDPSGGYAIDWRSRFGAGSADVLLRGGEYGGGYAGLSVRLAASTSKWSVLDSEGRRDLDANGTKARWLDFSFADAASGKEAGIAILDGPESLRHPSPWYVIMDPKTPFGYFSPALLFSEPFTLKAESSFTLRYRILVHPGRGDAAKLEAAWKNLLAR